MIDDPLTEHLSMRAIHKWRFWYLFDQGGIPQILYRRRGTKKDAKGTVINTLEVEWGDLEHKSLSAEAKQMFVDAWKEYRDWKEAMS